MSCHNPVRYTKFVATVLPMSLAITTALPVLAQRIQYSPPSSVGAPRVSNQGTVRLATCDNDSSCLMGILPSREKANNIVLTASKRPTIFLNVPDTAEGTITFWLYEQQPATNSEVRLYKNLFPLSAKSSIISFKLPEDAPDLEVGKDYHWIIEVQDSVSSSKIEGFIRRTTLDPDTIAKLNKATPLEQAAIYAKAGIWFDTVKTLADSRCSQPNSIETKQEWVQLLKSVRLDAIALQPVATSCKAQ